MDIFDLVASLSLDTSAYEQGLQGAEQDATSAGGKLGSVIGKIGGGAGIAIGAVVSGVTAISGAVVSGTTDLAEYADNIDKMSQKMGISAEAYQEWDAVMQHSGTSIESMTRGMQTLQKNAVNSAEKFEALGITQEQLASMSTEELFSATITGLQNMGEGAERTALASELLGGTAKELGALLNTSAEETQAMKDRVHELGGVLSDEAVKAGASFQDQLQDMQTAQQSLTRNMLSDFLPSITTVMGGLTDLFAGDYESGADKISQGIDNVITTVTEKLPQAMDIGADIILNLGESIVQNAPKILKAGMDVIKELALGLTDALPTLLDTASEIITTVLDSLTETLPELLPKLLSAVINLVERLIDHLPEILTSLLDLVQALVNSLLTEGLPMLLDALPDLIMGVVNFIISAIPQIITAVIDIVLAICDALPDIIIKIIEILPTLIVNIITAILGAIPQFVEAGIQLFIGLIGALPEIISALIEAVPLIITGLVDAFKQNWPKIKESGQKLLTSLASGLTNLGSTIKNAVKKIWDSLKSNFKSVIDNAKSWGKDLLQNFIDGIKSKISALTNVVKGVANKVKDFLGFSEPKDGPLSNFHTYAPDMMKLFAEGIKDNTDVVTDQIAKSFDFEQPVVDVTKADNSATMNSRNAEMDTIIELLQVIAEKDPVEISGNLQGIFDLVVKKNREYYKAHNRNALTY